jgi:hypothetical protein
MRRRDFWLVLAVAAGFGLVGGVLSGVLLRGGGFFPTTTPGCPNIITAKEFRVVDGDGSLRARLFLSQRDPALHLYDEDTQPRIVLSVTPASGAALVLRTAQGKDLQERPHDEEIRLTLSPSGKPVLSLLNKDRATFLSDAGLTLGRQREPALRLLSSSEGLALRVGEELVEPPPGPAMYLYDGEGNIRAALGSTPLRTSDAAVLGNQCPSSMLLLDQEGNVVWKTPIIQ